MIYSQMKYAQWQNQIFFFFFEGGGIKGEMSNLCTPPPDFWHFFPSNGVGTEPLMGGGGNAPMPTPGTATEYGANSNWQ